MPYLIFAIVFAFALLGWLADRNRRKREGNQLAESVEYRRSEEYVLKQQIQFEEHLAEIYLPDAIRGRELYIYRKLMRGWFEKLIAMNRYSEAVSKKIRIDWLAYMALLNSRATHRFLGLEASDKSKGEKYLREAQEEAVQIASIENGYAELIGPPAVEALRQTRERPYDDFSREGELAPEGHMFLGFSPTGEPEQPIPRDKIKR